MLNMGRSCILRCIGTAILLLLLHVIPALLQMMLHEDLPGQLWQLWQLASLLQGVLPQQEV